MLFGDHDEMDSKTNARISLVWGARVQQGRGSPCWSIFWDWSLPQFHQGSFFSMIHHLRAASNKLRVQSHPESSEVCQTSLWPQWYSFALWLSVSFVPGRPVAVWMENRTRSRRSMWPTGSKGGVMSVMQFSWALNSSFIDCWQNDIVILPNRGPMVLVQSLTDLDPCV